MRYFFLIIIEPDIYADKIFNKVKKKILNTPEIMGYFQLSTSCTTNQSGAPKYNART